MTKISINPNSDIKVFLPFDITHTPRAYNLINYLAAKGKKVTLFTCIVSGKVGEIKFPDQVSTVSLFDLTKKTLQTFLIKLRFKISRVLLEKFRIETQSSFGYGTKEFIKISNKDIHKNDVVFCFKEVGLMVGNHLIQAGHQNVIFDFEDWFSEDLPEKNRKYRPLKLIRKYEKNAIRQLSPILVPSIEMKLGFEKVFGKGNFHIYYNSFNSKNTEEDFKTNERNIKLIWFSQIVSFGRGLEEFFSILEHINHPVHLNLIGKVDHKFSEFIEQKFKNYNIAHSYTLHGFVKDKELDLHIMNVHFGLGLEKTEILSRDLTITYKCFRYLMNTTPLILSKTKGQEEFASITSNNYPIINFTNEAEIQESARQLNNLFSQVIDKDGYYLDLRHKTYKVSQKFEIYNILNEIVDLN
jgi:hypothetical protein